MNELTILDFALGIALLYHWGADGKEIRSEKTTSRLRAVFFFVRSLTTKFERTKVESS